MKNQLTTDLLERLLDAKLGTVDEKISNIAENLEDVKLAIYGNGKPGMLQRVDCVEDAQKNMLGKIGMVSAFFGLMIAGVFEIITRFFTKKIGME